MEGMVMKRLRKKNLSVRLSDVSILHNILYTLSDITYENMAISSLRDVLDNDTLREKLDPLYQIVADMINEVSEEKIIREDLSGLGIEIFPIEGYFRIEVRCTINDTIQTFVLMVTGCDGKIRHERLLAKPEDISVDKMANVVKSLTTV